MSTPEYQHSKLARAVAAALFFSFIVLLSVNSIGEPSPVFVDCDASVTGNCCLPAFGDSRLHEIFLEVVPACILSALVLTLAVFRQNYRRLLYLGFAGVGAVIGFASSVGEFSQCENPWRLSLATLQDYLVSLLTAIFCSALGLAFGAIASFFFDLISRLLRRSAS